MAQRREYSPLEEIARSESEAAFQRWVMLAARNRGWSYYHTDDSTGSQEGYPDLTLWRPGDRLIFAELKTQTGQITIDRVKKDRRGVTYLATGQATILLSLYEAWQEIHIWRPLDRDLLLSVLDHRGREGWEARSEQAFKEAARRNAMRKVQVVA